MPDKTLRLGITESVAIESDEEGFVLILDNGYDTFRFNIQNVALDLLHACEVEIRPWRTEGELVRGSVYVSGSPAAVPAEDYYDMREGK